MRPLATLLAAVIVVAVVPGAGAADAKTGAQAAVSAVLELGQQFYYVGDPLLVRLTIGNDGSAEVQNPVKHPVLESFRVSGADGKQLDAQGKAEAQEPARPAKLSPKAFYGAVVDLTQLFPQIKTVGSFKIRWSADGVSSDEITVRMIPKFDPSKDYVARVETEEGVFFINLLKRTSPIAVKAFVDLVNAGFYDGLLVHEVRSDQMIGAGDPTGSGGGQAPLRYPAETSSVPVVAGTVVMKPAGLAPPANSSQFVVALRPEPNWTGQFTVFGQVVEGLDIVRRIANLPNTARPAYKPLKDVHTLRVTIQERGAPEAGAAGMVN